MTLCARRVASRFFDACSSREAVVAVVATKLQLVLAAFHGPTVIKVGATTTDMEGHHDGDEAHYWGEWKSIHGVQSIPLTVGSRPLCSSAQPLAVVWSGPGFVATID